MKKNLIIKAYIIICIILPLFMSCATVDEQSDVSSYKETSATENLQGHKKILDSKTIHELKYGVEIKENLIIEAKVDLNKIDKKIIVNIENPGEDPVFIKRAELYCGKELKGIRVFKDEYGKFLKVPAGTYLTDIVDIFKPNDDSLDLVELVCADISSVLLITSMNNKFSKEVEIIKLK